MHSVNPASPVDHVGILAKDMGVCQDTYRVRKPAGWRDFLSRISARKPCKAKRFASSSEYERRAGDSRSMDFVKELSKARKDAETLGFRFVRTLESHG